MGYELRRQLREALGPEITGLQRAVALEIADDANDDTRESWVTLEDLARWTGAKDASVVRNALKRLAAGGWEFRVPIGKGKDGRVLYAVPGMRMTFRVPTFEGGATATPKGEPPLPQEGAPATPSPPQGGATAHSEGATAPSEGATAPPFSSYPSDPSEVITSPGRADEATNGSPQRDYAMTKFGAFWLAYPRSKQIEKAKQSWRDALDRGADPDHILAAAERYAAERAKEDPRYTPYPATWLDKGSYDDEPDPAPPPAHAANGAPNHTQWTMEDFHRGFAG